MDTLSQMKCVARRADSPRVTQAEIAECQPQVPVWQLLERDGMPRLERAYKFENFAEVLAFINEIHLLLLSYISRSHQGPFGSHLQGTPHNCLARIQPAHLVS